MEKKQVLIFMIAVKKLMYKKKIKTQLINIRNAIPTASISTPKIRNASIKGYVPPILANFLCTTFYNLKVTCGYIGESPENFMSKYTQEV